MTARSCSSYISVPPFDNITSTHLKKTLLSVEMFVSLLIPAQRVNALELLLSVIKI